MIGHIINHFLYPSVFLAVLAVLQLSSAGKQYRDWQIREKREREKAEPLILFHTWALLKINEHFGVIARVCVKCPVSMLDAIFANTGKFSILFIHTRPEKKERYKGNVNFHSLG